MRTLTFAVCAIVAALLVPSTAHAQSQRDGFFIGFGFGAGSLGVEDGDGREWAPSGYFKLGGALNDKILLGAEANGWVKTESEGDADVTLSSGSLMGSVYLYPSLTSGFYLRAGVGVASLDLEASAGGLSIGGSETGTAIGFGAGYDIGFGGRFALTPYANFVYSSFDGGSTNLIHFGLGVNWY